MAQSYYLPVRNSDPLTLLSRGLIENSLGRSISITTLDSAGPPVCD